MTARAHLALIALVSGGTATALTVTALEQWHMRWPLDLAWAALAVAFAAPLGIAYAALWSSSAPPARVRRACLHLFAGVYLAIATSMLLLIEALQRTR